MYQAIAAICDGLSQPRAMRSPGSYLRLPRGHLLNRKSSSPSVRVVAIIINAPKLECERKKVVCNFAKAP